MALDDLRQPAEFWLTGSFPQVPQDSKRWPKVQRFCTECGKAADFLWRYRKYVRWTCARHWLPRDNGFRSMVRMSDGLEAMLGEEIIALQFGHKRNVEVTSEQEKAVRTEMKRRGWR